MEQLLPVIIGGFFTLAGVWLTHYLETRRQMAAPGGASVSIPTSAPASAPAPSPVVSTTSYGPIVTDVGILWVLTAVGGFLVGATTSALTFEQFLEELAVANLVSVAVGFVLSGIRAKGNRWTHLLAVALVFWLSNLINIFLVGLDFASWIGMIPLILVTMAIGGAISNLFRK